MCLYTVAENRQCGSRGDIVRQSVPESTAGDREGTVAHGHQSRWSDSQ